MCSFSTATSVKYLIGCGIAFGGEMRTLLKLIFLPLFIVALMSLINLRDQKPDPGIDMFVRWEIPAVAPDENAYFSLCAHRVSAGRNAHAEGVAASKLMDALFRDNPVEAASSDGEGLIRAELTLTGDTSFLVGAGTGDVLAKYRGRDETIHTLLEENKELAGRYRDLYSYPRFRETTPFDANALDADFTSIKETHRLILADIALSLHAEDVDTALAALEGDVRFWKMVLGSARHLGSKMTAVGVLGRDVRFLSGVVRAYGLGPDEASLAASMLRPLDEEERSLRGTMGSECAFGMQLVTGTFAEASDKKQPFFKEQATRNLIYKQFRDDLPLYSLSAQDFHERAEKAGDRSPRKNPFYYLYNPIGKLVHQISQPDFAAFQYKLHELDTFLSLVRLQLAADSQSVPHASLGVFFQASCPPYCDPFTMGPFDWDTETSALSFALPIGGKSIIIRDPEEAAP